MVVHNTISQLRQNAHLSQEEFAELFHVSRQSVQKWENGLAKPELEKLVDIANYFGVSLDSLILGRDKRAMETLEYNAPIRPQYYDNWQKWELYASDLLTEYKQSVEEGLDISAYKELFSTVSTLPNDEIKKKLGDTLFEIIQRAKILPEYPYLEPSALEEIRALRTDEVIGFGDAPETALLRDKLRGAWLGRICGCMLGKTVECIRTNELTPFLKETGNYPMHRYIYRSDLTEERCKKYPFFSVKRICADEIDAMPVDDDTNYVVLGQLVLENYGRDFTAYDVSRAWLNYQKKDAYCTAERVAYRNFINGYVPPQSACFQNPYREWIGAQIRGDYYGYINPGDPALAAEMAWRDASISHVKNGIYGEMFVSAMLAAAAVTADRTQILRAGLAQIPRTSRLHEAVTSVLEQFESGVSQQAVFKGIHRKYDEHSPHDWCHTIPNAMIVAASLLYGRGDFGRTICMSVETGFDTDCNGATVGSILGMACGAGSIPEYWSAPFHDTLQTSIFGVGTVSISDCAEKTLAHIQMQQ